MSLRPYQVDCNDAILAAWRGGENRLLASMPTGCGKAISLAELIRQLMSIERAQALVLAHREEIVDQLAATIRRRNPRMIVGIERAQDKCDPATTDIIVGSVETLGRATEAGAGRWNYCDRLAKFDRNRVKYILPDECFPAGTLVDGRPIETISVGDTVSTFRAEPRSVRRGRVTRLFRKSCARLVRVVFRDGTSLACTPNHPVFDASCSGYVRADLLNCDSMVLCITASQRSMLQSRHETDAEDLLCVRDGVHATQLEPPDEAVLLSGVQGQGTRSAQDEDRPAVRGVWEGRAVRRCASESCEEGKGVLLRGAQAGVLAPPTCGNSGGDEQKICLRAHEEAQPDARSGSSREDEHHASRDGMEADRPAREWPRADCPRDAARVSARLGDERSSLHRDASERLPVVLQDRRRQPDTYDRNRGGRQQPLLQESAGSQEGAVLAILGVDHIEILEPGGGGEFERLCPGGVVYNLEVEGDHTYFANGIAVHNCHRSVAPSFQHVFRYFKCLKSDPATNDPAKLLVGWTATPQRGDNVGLEEVFDRMVFWRDIRTMIDDGWLAPVKAYRVDTGIDISAIKSRGGDFIVKELERAVNVEKRNELILQKYLEMGNKMGFFCFTVDVQHSEDMAALFRRNGIEAYPVSYKTPKQERRALINAMRERKIDGLCSCAALTEGTDVPAASVALMTRPTKSALLYTQSLGRVLRPYPSPEDMAGMAFLAEKPAWVKPYAVVLDFVDVCGKHRISGVPTLFGLRQDYKFDKQKTVTEELNEIDEMAKKAKGIDLTKYSNVIEMRAAVEAIDLFAVPSVPEVVQQYSKLAWTAAFSGGYNLHLPERLSFALRQNALGQWDVFRTVKGVREFMRTLPNIGLAFQMADNLVPQDKIGVVLTKAKWRNQEATPDQIKTLGKYRKDMRAKFPDYKDFTAWVKKTYTKGDVSRLLDEVFGKRRRA